VSCVRIHAYMHTYTPTHIHINTYMRTHLHTYICIRTCVCTYVHTYVHTYIPTHTYNHYLFTQEVLHVHTQRCKHTYTYTCIHTCAGRAECHACGMCREFGLCHSAAQTRNSQGYLRLTDQGGLHTPFSSACVYVTVYIYIYYVYDWIPALFALLFVIVCAARYRHVHHHAAWSGAHFAATK
jgi:hypothetical protein